MKGTLRKMVLTRQARHVDTVGALDHGHHAVSSGGAREEGEEEDVGGMHDD